MMRATPNPVRAELVEAPLFTFSAVHEEKAAVGWRQLRFRQAQGERNLYV
jgi:hypothetical protein